MRVERLLPLVAQLLEKHPLSAFDAPIMATSARQLAAIVDDVQQELRRQHNQDMRDAERDARDAFSEGKYEGEQSARQNY